MSKRLQWSRFIVKIAVLILVILINGCRTTISKSCQLPCQLGIDQADPLTVQDFLDILLKSNWIQDDPERALQAMYGRDKFSNVLETTTSIQIDATPWPIFGSEIKLYIGNVGTVILDHVSIPSENIEAIQVTTNIPIVLSWLLYGFPEGGRVFPVYQADDLNETNPCPNQSHYIAYYDKGNVIIRAVVQRPILINLWLSPVEIIYPLDESLETSSWWIGKFERMDHVPCMPD